MKKLIYTLLFGILMSACASMKTFNDPNVSLYMGRFGDVSCYFYLNRGGEFYMLNFGKSCEVGECRISQDTLYCYPRLYKSQKSDILDFKEDKASQFYWDVTDSIYWQDLFEIKYLLTEDRLYSLTAVIPKVYSNIFSFPEDAFLEKIEIKDLPKYSKKVLRVY